MRDTGVRLMLGDALELLPKLATGSVDAVVTDPPYSSGGMFRGDRQQDTRTKYQQSGQLNNWAAFAGDARDQRGWEFWCVLWLSQCKRIVKPGGVVCMFADWRQLPTATDALQGANLIYRGIVAWDKTESARPCMGRFRSQCEYVAWGTNGRRSLDRHGVGVLPGVFRVTHKNGDKHHLAGKPVEVMRGLVGICPPGGTVLDPFGGSGTTAVACRETGRNCISIEIDPGYHAIARRRIAAARRQVREAAHRV